MAIDNQFRINELISSGSKAIVSKDVETGKHTFVTNADTIVLSKSEGGDAPYTHIRGERDGEQVGRIEKQKYDEEQLIKSVDVEVVELIGKPKKPKPDVVPRPVYEDLRRLYQQALADLAEANARIAELESEIQSLNAEIEALLIENDSLKIQKASADNEAQSSTQRYSDLLKDFSNSIIKGTRDGIERVSLTAQVQGLQAQKEALRQLLVQTQSQLSGAQAESTAAASGLTPGKDNEFFYKVESVTKAAKDADIGWTTAKRKNVRPSGKAGYVEVQNLKDNGEIITKLEIRTSGDITGWGPLGFTEATSKSPGPSKTKSVNIEQGAKEKVDLYFNVKIGGQNKPDPSKKTFDGGAKDYKGNWVLKVTYSDGTTSETESLSWAVRKNKKS